MWDSRWRSSVIGSVGLVLTAYACNGSSGGSSDGGGAGGSGTGGTSVSTSAANGGTSAGGTSSTTASVTTGGSAGAAGEVGEGGDGGTAMSTATGGAAGAPAEICEAQSPPDEACDYPESFGGGSDSEACGVTPGAWYGLGNSAPTTWPERDLSEWSSGVGIPTVTEKWGAHQLAFDPDGLPVVLWQEAVATDEFAMRVRRWDGASWVDLEAYSVETRREAFDLAVDSEGRVLVAQRAPGLVKVLRYEDSEWVSLGEWAADPDSYYSTYEIIMALDAEDRPTVLYDGLRLMRWTGSAWEGLGGSELPEGIDGLGGHPALALQANGDPVVASSLGGHVRLRQWQGSSWEELDGSATDEGLGESEDDGVALAVDASDQIVVAWSGQYRVWDGDAWSPADDVGGARPRLARGAEDDLYLMTDGMTTDAEVIRERLLYHWQADAWEPLAELVAEYDEGVDLAVAPDGGVGAAFGRSFVRYADYAGDSWTEQPTVAGADATMTRGVLRGGPMLVDGCVASSWNGASWEVLVAPTLAEDCDFARNDDGVVHLAFWTQDSDDIDHLRVARHAANGWELLGDLQSTDSSYGLWSRYSVLRFDAAGNPLVLTEFEDEVAWVEISRWSGSDWVHFEGPGLGNEAFLLGFEVTPDSRPVLAADYFDDGWERRRVSEWTGETWRRSVVASRDRATDPEFTHYGLVVDDAGAPVLVSKSDAGLALLKEVGSEWKQVAPTEAVLESLPRAVRVDARSEGGEAFFRYFADCSWHGLSASDHEGGVSNSVASSTLASVAVSESEVCVAWQDQLEAGDRMLLRCHEW